MLTCDEAVYLTPVLLLPIAVSWNCTSSLVEHVSFHRSGTFRPECVPAKLFDLEVYAVMCGTLYYN